jgi:hypothetical protein
MIATAFSMISPRKRRVVGANRDQPAITNLELTMECNKSFGSPTVPGAETSAAEGEDHRMLSFQFRELPVFRGVVGKLVVGKDSPWNDVGSHTNWVTGVRLNGSS